VVEAGEPVAAHKPMAKAHPPMRAAVVPRGKPAPAVAPDGEVDPVPLRPHAANDRVKRGLESRGTTAVLDEWRVVIPLGLGVAVGIVIVSQALRFLLRKHAPPTLGVLLGLLVGAVAGLWPFQQAIEPQPGDTLKGQTGTHVIERVGQRLAITNLDEIGMEDWPTGYFTPTAPQAAGALDLAAAGFLATAALGMTKRREYNSAKTTQSTTQTRTEA